MIKSLQKEKEKYDEAIEQIVEMQEDVLLKTSEITFKALGVLLNRLVEVSDDLLEVSVKKDYFDKELSTTLKETITEAIIAFSKINPPTINVAAPEINLQPIQSLAVEIKKQNENIIALLNKPNQSEELQKLITAMASKQIAFLEKEFQQIDNTFELKYIGEGVNKKTSYVGVVTKRDFINGMHLIQEFEINPKNDAKTK